MLELLRQAHQFFVGCLEALQDDEESFKRQQREAAYRHKQWLDYLSRPSPAVSSVHPNIGIMMRIIIVVVAFPFVQPPRWHNSKCPENAPNLPPERVSQRQL